jgi:hypothetical protein
VGGGESDDVPVEDRCGAERGETFNVGLERKIIGQSAGGGHQNRLWQLCQVIEIFETTTGKFIRFEIRFLSHTPARF